MSDEIRDAVVVVTQVVDRLDSLKARAAGMEALIESCHTDAASALNDLDSGHRQLLSNLELYRQTADSNMALITDRLTALSDSLQVWSQVGQQDAAQYQSELVNLEKAYQQFEARCKTTSATCDKAAATANQACEQLISQVNNSIQQIQSESQSLYSEIGSLTNTLTQSAETASSTGQAVAEKMKESLESCQERIKEMIQEIQGAGDSYEDAIVELCDGTTIPKLEELADQLKEFLQDKVKQTIDEVFEELSDQCKTSAGQIFGLEDEDSIYREAIEPLIKQLDDLLKPLTEAARHVKSVADKIKSAGIF